MPIGKDISDRIAQDHDRIVVDGWSEIKELVDDHPEYLYFESTDGVQYFYPVEGSIERQYLRKRICEAIGISTDYADWREYPFEEKRLNTAEKLIDSEPTSTT